MTLLGEDLLFWAKYKGNLHEKSDSSTILEKVPAKKINNDRCEASDLVIVLYGEFAPVESVEVGLAGYVARMHTCHPHLRFGRDQV